jgi:hypothetical protein
MAARPTVSVFSAQGESSGSLPLPAVFTAPIRLDVVQQVHSESLFFQLRIGWIERGKGLGTHPARRTWKRPKQGTQEKIQEEHH